MADATGEAKQPPLRVSFDRRIKLEFHGARITSDGGLLVYRELDDACGLTTMAAPRLAEGRRASRRTSTGADSGCTSSSGRRCPPANPAGVRWGELDLAKVCALVPTG